VRISRDYSLKIRTNKHPIGKIPRYEIISSHPLKYLEVNKASVSGQLDCILLIPLARSLSWPGLVGRFISAGYGSTVNGRGCLYYRLECTSTSTPWVASGLQAYIQAIASYSINCTAYTRFAPGTAREGKKVKPDTKAKGTYIAVELRLVGALLLRGGEVFSPLPGSTSCSTS
jgi:hypothetical protein